MPADSKLTLSAASAIIDVALAKGQEVGLLPLTVAVLDSGGNIIALKREDGSGIMRPQIATGKAWGSLGMGVSSRTLRDRLADRPTFLNALATLSGGRLVPVPGGVLVRTSAGEILGAVGISGDASDKDEFCAIAAVAAAGFQPDPARTSPDWAKASL
ncbi:MAG: heme-binding protein [Deltaproteobacteria bacterium]|nr:heme-binding protein [Deltaproteobacteria bacterium]